MCWVHKIANVLDKLPKRMQSDAKTYLHEMMNSSTEADALKSRQSFENLFQEKHPKDVECLVKSWSELITFFRCPGIHWQHLRTINPIEASFATVKLRTKGAGSKETAATMAFKLLQECQKKWRRLRGHEEIKYLLQGLPFKEGVMIPGPSHHEAVAG